MLQTSLMWLHKNDFNILWKICEMILNELNGDKILIITLNHYNSIFFKLKDY
jgi:hypothetical protein